MGVSQILSEIDREIAQLTKARALLMGEAAPKKTAGRPKKTAVVAVPAKKAAKKKRNLSPEGRQRIAEAVKKRWAKQKKNETAAAK
jgi:chorismate mutase